MTQPGPTILRVPPFSSLCNAGFALRREVFVLEQNVPQEQEMDAFDFTATHFVAVVEGEILGALRMIEAEEHVKIGRVAVKASARGRGIAKAMMLAAMAHARAQGRDRFYLTSQLDKIAFYEKLGFAAFGAVFQDAGIPHRAMRTY